MSIWTHYDFMDMQAYNRIMATKGAFEASVYETMVKIFTRNIVKANNANNECKPSEMTDRAQALAAQNALSGIVRRLWGAYQGREDSANAIEQLRADLKANNRWWESKDPLTRLHYQFNRDINAFFPSEMEEDAVTLFGEAFRAQGEERKEIDDSYGYYQPGSTYFKRIKEIVEKRYSILHGSTPGLRR